ncbi:MAG: hypothetical protein JXA11_06655 [Phycisphaerae bacterium]|nr:hypothetical protein [Phycisphaerae bacterium]
MARKRKNTSATKTPRTARFEGMRNWIRDRFAARGQVTAKVICWFVFLAAILVGGAAGLTAVNRYAHQTLRAEGPVKYTVKLDAVPEWMPATLGRMILADVTPREVDFDDPALGRVIYEQAIRNPWIAQVEEVRRERLSATEAVIRVRAQYRQPIARVSREGRMYYVDGRGVILPYSQTPKFAVKDGDDVKYFVHRDAVPSHLMPIRIHYIAVEGVEAPPPAVGQAWEGEDLAQGLRLVRLLGTRPWANQISVVDARNHARRISESEPELCIYAQQGRGKPTEIRFGRFPHPDGGDWVISPARKMRYLDDYVQDQNGRLAGIHSYIDVRFDELRVSLN